MTHLMLFLLISVFGQTYLRKTGLNYQNLAGFMTSVNTVAYCQTLCNSEALCQGFLYRLDWAFPQCWLLYRIYTANTASVFWDSYLKNGFTMPFSIILRPGTIIDTDISTTDVGISYTKLPGDCYNLYTLPMTLFSYTPGGPVIITMTSVAYHVAPVLATDYSGTVQTNLAGPHTLASCITACFRNTTCGYVYFTKSMLRCGLLATLDSTKLSNTTTPTFSDFSIVQKTWTYDSRYYAYPNYQMSGVPFLNTLRATAQLCQTACSGCAAFQYFYTNTTCFLYDRISSIAKINEDVTLFLWNTTSVSTTKLTSNSPSTSVSTLSTTASSSLNNVLKTTSLVNIYTLSSFILVSTSSNAAMLTHTLESATILKTTEIDVPSSSEVARVSTVVTLTRDSNNFKSLNEISNNSTKIDLSGAFDKQLFEQCTIVLM